MNRLGLSAHWRRKAEELRCKKSGYLTEYDLNLIGLLLDAADEVEDPEQGAA